MNRHFQKLISLLMIFSGLQSAKVVVADEYVPPPSGPYQSSVIIKSAPVGNGRQNQVYKFPSADVLSESPSERETGQPAHSNVAQKAVPGSENRPEVAQGREIPGQFIEEQEPHQDDSSYWQPQEQDLPQANSPQDQVASYPEYPAYPNQPQQPLTTVPTWQSNAYYPPQRGAGMGIPYGNTWQQQAPQYGYSRPYQYPYGYSQQYENYNPFNEMPAPWSVMKNNPFFSSK